MAQQSDPRLAEFHEWKRRWKRNVIIGYGILVAGLIVAIIVIANVAADSHALSTRVQDRSADFCRAVRVNRADLALNTELANDGLRSITPNVPPSRESQDVIERRQSLRRSIDLVNCRAYFDGE